jgi:hypothetical protein
MYTLLTVKSYKIATATHVASHNFYVT